MKYISTRGQAPELSFCDILLGGLAPDGGLYLPRNYPRIGRAELDRWRGLPYADLAFELLSLFVDDIPAADLKALCVKTYRADVYCHVRHGQDSGQITPVVWLEEGKLGLLELSNGPTLAFKDMAMQLLGNLFEYELKRRGEHINILGATSGDTGSAAEYAMRGKAGVNVFMLSPHGKMSDFQRAQMYSLQDPNIYNLAVTGMFDDAQDVVKAVFTDASFKARYKIGAVNSINWARILAQIVYYFQGYFLATKSNDERIAFCVPSGNFGNICAGHIARMMGLPIEKLILATNENDVLDEFFKSGRYRPRSTAETQVTSSPSMDISKASNFERFAFDLVGRDAAKIRELWAQVDSGQGFDLSSTQYYAPLADYAFISGKSSHTERIATIREIWERYGTLIDTHTADGMYVALALRGSLPKEIPILVLETAQPAKFAASIKEAVGRLPPLPDDLANLESLPQRFEVIPADAVAVKEFIAAHAD